MNQCPGSFRTSQLHQGGGLPAFDRSGNRLRKVRSKRQGQGNDSRTLALRPIPQLRHKAQAFAAPGSLCVVPCCPQLQHHLFI